MNIMNKQEAEKGAKDLKNKLGKGWKIRVWENLGWHYEVLKGCICIFNSGKKYSSLISDDPNQAGIGDPALDTDFIHEDPRKVVSNCVKTIKNYYEKIKSLKECAEKIEKELK